MVIAVALLLVVLFTIILIFRIIKRWNRRYLREMNHPNPEIDNLTDEMKMYECKTNSVK